MIREKLGHQLYKEVPFLESISYFVHLIATFAAKLPAIIEFHIWSIASTISERMLLYLKYSLDARSRGIEKNLS